MIQSMQSFSFSYLDILHIANMFLGITPVETVVGRNQAIDPFIFNTLSEADATVSKYKIHFVRLSFSIILLFITIHHVRENIFELILYMNYNSHNCFQKNFCLYFIELSILNVQPICHLYSILLHRVKQKLACVRCLTKLFYNLNETDQFKPSKNPFYLFIFFHFLGLINTILKPRKSYLNGVFDYYLFASSVSMKCCIMTYYHIIHKTLTSINGQIEEMVGNKDVNCHTMDDIIMKHWQTGDLTVDINVCYGMNLLFSWPFHIVHTIMFLMSIPEYMGQKMYSWSTIVDLILQFIPVLVFLTEIVFFSRAGTLITNEVAKTKTYIEKLKWKLEEKLAEREKILLKKFKLKISARKIQITANDYLKINMQLIHSFLELIITYWIVLVQFRNN